MTRIKLEKVAEWADKWERSFESISADPSSIKTLVYLALLERQHEMSSYDDIAEQLRLFGAIEGDVDDRFLRSVRSGMFQLVRTIERAKLYEIKKDKIGKQSFYRLEPREQSETVIETAREGELVDVLERDLTASMNSIAERLIRDRRMPFYSIYLPMRAASRWVVYSEKEAEERRQYEGEQCEILLREWLGKYRDAEISIVGLGVGEGIGEIELIEKLLSPKYGFKRIHYCAIDINIHLLLDHVERLRDKFKDEIRERRLVCGVIRGNFLKNFCSLIQTLRGEFKKREQFADLLHGFLPQNAGTIISILGNLLGNLEHRASEWTYLQPVLEGLKGHSLAFLLGVSVQQKNKNGKVIKEKYERDLDDLFLATPKYLTHDLGILKTGQPLEDRTEVGEFLLPDDETKKEERCPAVQEATYQGEGIIRGGQHIKGSIYEFFYTTKWALSMEVDGETLSVPKGTNLLLYNIVKFDRHTLIRFLESKGLRAPETAVRDYKVGMGALQRVYAVLAVTTES